MRWYRIRRKRGSSVTKHYLAHKEQARALVLSRLSHFNNHYNLAYNRVAIRNQRRCWGSCTSLKNLNFSYKILFLPAHLQDYIVAHELCHVQELNHKKAFWALLAQTIPDYQIRVQQLRSIEKGGTAVSYLERLQKNTESFNTQEYVMYTKAI